MTKADLTAIRARANAATPGPWRYTYKDCQYHMSSCFIDREGDPDGVGIVTCDINQDNADLYATTGDMELIAHARTDIPALCDALEQAMRALAVAEELLDAGEYYDDEAREHGQQLIRQWEATDHA